MEMKELKKFNEKHVKIWITTIGEWPGFPEISGTPYPQVFRGRLIIIGDDIKLYSRGTMRIKINTIEKIEEDE